MELTLCVVFGFSFMRNVRRFSRVRQIFLGGNVVVVGLRVLCGALSRLCRPVYLCFKIWEKGSKV